MQVELLKMSFLSQAIAETEGSVTDECEYCQFLLMDKDKLKELVDKCKEFDNMVFFEGNIPTTLGHSRIRKYVEENKCELTTKIKVDKNVNKENNVDINDDMYKSLLTITDNIVLRRRVFIPIIRDGQVIKKRDGSDLAWELDLYVNADSFKSAEECTYGLWVKLELEVDKITLDNVVDYIPFEYEQLIISSTTDKVERATIDNLYDNVYNLRHVM